MASNAETALEYYKRVDAGQDDLLDLFDENFELFFPKFGIARGKAAFGSLATGLFGSLNSIAHDQLRVIDAGDTVVIEGTTHGATIDGTEWKGGETPGGRFCSVFEFGGGLITRMFIYLDPDYGSHDKDRFLWNDVPGRTW